MATARLPMRKAREILRQKLQRGLSHRQVAQSVGVGAGSVGDVMSRAKVAQLDLAKVRALSEDALQQVLYGPRSPATGTRVRHRSTCAAFPPSAAWSDQDDADLVAA